MRYVRNFELVLKFSRLMSHSPLFFNRKGIIKGVLSFDEQQDHSSFTLICATLE